MDICGLRGFGGPGVEEKKWSCPCDGGLHHLVRSTTPSRHRRGLLLFPFTFTIAFAFAFLIRTLAPQAFACDHFSFPSPSARDCVVHSQTERAIFSLISGRTRVTREFDGGDAWWWAAGLSRARVYVSHDKSKSCTPPVEPTPSHYAPAGSRHDGGCRRSDPEPMASSHLTWRSHPIVDERGGAGCLVQDRSGRVVMTQAGHIRPPHAGLRCKVMDGAPASSFLSPVT